MVILLYGRIYRASGSSHSARVFRWGAGRALYLDTYYGIVEYLDLNVGYECVW